MGSAEEKPDAIEQEPRTKQPQKREKIRPPTLDPFQVSNVEHQEARYSETDAEMDQESEPILKPEETFSSDYWNQASAEHR